MNWKQKSSLVTDPISAPCDCSPEEVDYDSGRLEALNRHFQSLIEEGTILSASYCLWRRGKVFADAALGKLACPWQGRDRFMPDTFYELQSVAKIFTAVAILKLAEDGMLYLGQPVRDWIPEFSAEGFREITLVQLLIHTSGLCALPGAWPQDPRTWWENIDKSRVRESWIPAVIKTGLHAKPGEKWIYSSVGYPILGEIIGRASGIRAEDYIKQYILLPCGMAESHWREDVSEEWIKRYNISKPYDVELVRGYGGEGVGDFARPTFLWWDEIPCTAGGVMSTGREMIRFGEMLLRDGSYRGNRVIGRTALSYLWSNLVGDGLRDTCWDHPGNLVVYGAGMPIITHSCDLQQMTSENVIYHEGSGSCVFLADKAEDFVVMFQTSFPREEDWCWEAVKGTVSIVWSGLK